MWREWLAESRAGEEAGSHHRSGLASVKFQKGARRKVVREMRQKGDLACAGIMDRSSPDDGGRKVRMKKFRRPVLKETGRIQMGQWDRQG